LEKLAANKFILKAIAFLQERKQVERKHSLWNMSRVLIRMEMQFQETASYKAAVKAPYAPGYQGSNCNQLTSSFQ